MSEDPVTPTPAPAPTVQVHVRPFYRDPMFLAAIGLFGYLVAENLDGKELNRANVGAAVIAAVIAFGRLLAPYVRTFVPWFDRALPPKNDVKEPRT